MTELVVWSILIAASLLTIASTVREAWRAHRQRRWDRHVAAAVALALEPIYSQLAAEQPEAVEAMERDWAAWETEVAE